VKKLHQTESPRESAAAPYFALLAARAGMHKLNTPPMGGGLARQVRPGGSCKLPGGAYA